MNSRISQYCAWSGIVFGTLFFIGWGVLARFIPPHDPTLTGEQIAAIYQASTVEIRLGMFIMMVVSVLYLPWTAVLADQIAKIEGRFSILSCLQLASGALNVLLFSLPTMIWAAVAFRPERSPDITLFMNDLGWLLFVGLVSPFVFSPISLGIATLVDKRPQPAFPRWFGYLNLWVALLLMPGGLIMFFKTGPFAWNGILTFWMPMFVFGSWMTLTLFLLLQAIKRQANETGP
jgi:hypothetical protein